MKNLLVLILVTMGFFVTQAQHETVFSKSKNWGAFGSFNYDYGLNKNNFTSTAGGGFGLVIGSMFVGGYGNSIADLDHLADNEPFIDLAHGGLWLGYTPMSPKVLHPIIGLKLGSGAIDIDFEDENQDFHNTDFVSVITPEIGVELNITKIFRLALTGNYRFVRGVEASNPKTNKDFEGFNIGLGLRIGWFGKWRDANRCDEDKKRSKISIDLNRNSDDDYEDLEDMENTPMEIEAPETPEAPEAPQNIDGSNN